MSSGIEPVFQFCHTRRVLDRNGEYIEFELEDHAYSVWRGMHGDRVLPEEFVSALDIHPQDHLAMQAALQPFVDNAISKTINIPVDFPFEEFRTLYQTAWEKQLKGCTTFRPNPVTGEVLSLESSAHCCTIEREAD